MRKLVLKMGSRTFQDMLAYWPTSSDPMAAPMNEIPKVVFSKHSGANRRNDRLITAALKDAPREPVGLAKPASSEAAQSWARATVVTGDLSEEIMQLKAQPGNYLLAHGGASFARSLVQRKLVDEFWLLVHPVVLGSGLPLFSGLSAPFDLELLNTTAFGAGVVAHPYRPG
jgi:dihydrofolate reductase